MQQDKPVKIPTVKIERDKETQRVTNVKRLSNSTYTARNNAEAFILKQDMAAKLSKLKK